MPSVVNNTPSNGQILNWSTPAHRQLGVDFLNHLATSTSRPWSTLHIPINGWRQWRDALVSPYWSTAYPDNQPHLHKALCRDALDHFATYEPPTKAKLCNLIKLLATEAETNAADGAAVTEHIWTIQGTTGAATIQGTTGAAGVSTSKAAWQPKELGAIALGFWLLNVFPSLGDNYVDAALSDVTVKVVQQLIPRRTIKSIKVAIIRRMDDIRYAWELIMGVEHQSPEIWLLKDENILSHEHIEILAEASEKQGEAWYVEQHDDETDSDESESE